MALPYPGSTPRVRGAAQASHERRLAEAHPKTPSAGNPWAGDMTKDPRFTEAVARGAGQAELDQIIDKIKPEYEQAKVSTDWLRPHISEVNARNQERAAERQAAAQRNWEKDVEHTAEFVDAMIRGDYAKMNMLRARDAAMKQGTAPDHAGHGGMPTPATGR
jgi:hypothetical protein